MSTGAPVDILGKCGFDWVWLVAAVIKAETCLSTSYSNKLYADRHFYYYVHLIYISEASLDTTY